MKHQQTYLPELPIDERTARYAREIANLPGVSKMQVLPDAYTKEKYIGLDYKLTIPSSSVIVTDSNVLYPQFRSRGINCGMMAVALPCYEKDLTPVFIESLSKELTFDPLYYLLYRLRLPWYRQTHDLSYDTFLEVLSGQHGGKSIDVQRVKSLLNSDWLSKRTVRMRHHFGRYFGGNHYFELQIASADSLENGVSKGQVIALYHTGCEGIQSVVRQDLAKQYFYQPEYVKAEQGGEMYASFFAAQQILENYTNAYREATKNIVDAVTTKYFGSSTKTIVNRGHNNVRKEKVGDADSIVYRHNIQKLSANEIGIVSGTYNHASYLVQGGKNIVDLTNSLDHGVGSVIARDPFCSDSNRQVRLERCRYGVRQWSKTINDVPLIKSQYADSYFAMLEEKSWADIVTELVPVFNLKYNN
jgi:RNA-splicing ligase RtcB